MTLLGNVLWVIFGGFISWLGWLMTGLICCITIIGIPAGLQCFKLAQISLLPFGREIIYPGGSISFLLNLIWIVLFGLSLAVTNAVIGLIWCVTIVGIPFGKQFFKIAQLSLMPFGAEVVRV
ncbi:MAG: YccF domain-containing protein [Clostridiales bacterium]|nr:YccF domain-containing protein [Clostridiales bacterium]MDD7035726.1 YccF domain-containing protein [Bacillota bacterium]MDY2920625.1 YccF domain-containing protein [Lentihominibacter sp.]